ncbi:hypothetical protein BH09VER1_BH09VER1_43940 [soil metagenome]
MTTGAIIFLAAYALGGLSVNILIGFCDFTVHRESLSAFLLHVASHIQVAFLLVLLLWPLVLIVYYYEMLPEVETPENEE